MQMLNLAAHQSQTKNPFLSTGLKTELSSRPTVNKQFKQGFTNCWHVSILAVLALHMQKYEYWVV